MRQTKKFIVLLKNKIVAEYHTADGINAVKKCLKKINYDTIEEVPIDVHTRIGKNKKEYDTGWKLKKLSVRVADGYAKIPEGHKLENEKLVPMNLQEKVDAGLIIIPEGMKVENNSFVEMTTTEKVKAGVITQKEANAIEKEKLIQEKMLAIKQSEDDALRQRAIAELEKEKNVQKRKS